MQFRQPFRRCAALLTFTTLLFTSYHLQIQSATSAERSSHPQPGSLSIETSNAKLQRTFEWAIQKARSYVQTGKSGIVDGSERQREGAGAAQYIPSYWAGYTWRTAFYSRDFCHQADGAHLLGLRDENLSMLRAFAGSATPGRKWYPLWALNFDGSPFRLDYDGDNSFVREVPAVFELVEQCHRQFLWTGNRAYVTDPVLRAYCENAVTEFVRLHDTRLPNGVAEGDGSGDIFRGSATYNEIRSPLIEAGDGIGAEYQAFLAYSGLCAARGERKQAQAFQQRAEELFSFFNTKWGIANGNPRYVRGYDREGKAQTDFGRENSWFMPMKRITQPSGRTEAYLDFIAQSVETPEGKPSNLEAISYLPGVFWPYHRDETAWKWLEHIMDQPDREYPEISYTLISHVVEGMQGFEPNAPEHSFLTVPRLPKAVSQVLVRNIPLGDHRIDLSHEGNAKSLVRHSLGRQPLKWKACFYGSHEVVLVNGKQRRTQPLKLCGVRACCVTVRLRAGEIATVQLP